MTRINRLLAANRNEIAIRIFRSAHELGIRTVAIYSHEDRYALHRFNADEAYEVGRAGEPIQAYLEIDAIIALAKKHEVDSIHPGYGFLSENPLLAQACRDAGILFVGPQVEILKQLGDKISARKISEQVGVPVLIGGGSAIRDAKQGERLASKVGYAAIQKAAHGGGGRGMRVVRQPDQFESAFEQAKQESLTAFGSPDIFVEKFIQRARHIEVQILGDAHGNLVHLYERDCSVQRRHQKVVEIAPAPNLSADIRLALCDAALAIGREVNYENAGTVEFLVDADTNQFYFIEVNPRIQVEHTVTEQVTITPRGCFSPALPAGLFRLRPTPAELCGHQHSANAGIPLRAGIRRRNRSRYRTGQDFDCPLPDNWRAARGRYADRFLRAQRSAARRDHHRSCS